MNCVYPIAITPHRRPKAGLPAFVCADPANPAFIWCIGQRGYGFQTAPAASQLLADLVAGRPSALDKRAIAALKPDRFCS